MRKALVVMLTALAVAVAIALLRRGQPEIPTATVSPDSSLDGLTRDELYQLAQERNIPGRSKMKKDELRDALRRA